MTDKKIEYEIDKAFKIKARAEKRIDKLYALLRKNYDMKMKKASGLSK